MRAVGVHRGMVPEPHPLDALVPRGYTTILEWFEERFTPEPNSGCWLWTRGVITSSRNGRVRPHATLKGKRQFVGSRLAYLIYRGPIPDGLLVCHRCDVPLCVNPDHLWLGTNAQNLADMRIKGRAAAGNRNSRSKLTEDDVAIIRSSLIPKSELAEQFGVTSRTIRDIKTRRTWVRF